MPQRQVSDGSYMRLAVRIFFDFGVSIAVPAVVAALVGVRLDSRWGTEPWVLILLLIVAFLSTGVWIYKKANYYKKLYENTV